MAFTNSSHQDILKHLLALIKPDFQPPPFLQFLILSEGGGWLRRGTWDLLLSDATAGINHDYFNYCQEKYLHFSLIAFKCM